MLRLKMLTLVRYAKAADVEGNFQGYYTKTEIEDKGYAVATEVASTYAITGSLKNMSRNC